MGRNRHQWGSSRRMQVEIQVAGHRARRRETTDSRVWGDGVWWAYAAIGRQERGLFLDARTKESWWFCKQWNNVKYVSTHIRSAILTKSICSCDASSWWVSPSPFGQESNFWQWRWLACFLKYSGTSTTVENGETNQTVQQTSQSSANLLHFLESVEERMYRNLPC